MYHLGRIIAYNVSCEGHIVTYHVSHEGYSLHFKYHMKKTA